MDGAILLDTEMQVILANPTSRRLLGWENKDILGNNVLHILPDPIRAELTRPLQAAAQGEADGGEFRISIKDPLPRTVRIVLATVIDQVRDKPMRDKPKGIAITVQDITREVELNEAKSQFISNVSHELRTPLFNIKSFIETLHEYGDSLSKEDRLEFLETANHETDRLTRLVNDVLDLSRLESGKQYRFEMVDLTQPIEQTLRTCQLNARDKGIELIQDIDPNLPPIWGHYDLLLQVLINLVGNALKFTLSGGKVAIRAYCLPVLDSATDAAAATVRVEVADTGVGISQEDQVAVFERFYRVENRVHTLEGTGLGLSIVRNIMDKHHSRIHLVSEVGVGTTFWFDLEVYQTMDVPLTKIDLEKNARAEIL